MLEIGVKRSSISNASFQVHVPSVQGYRDNNGDKRDVPSSQRSGIPASLADSLVSSGGFLANRAKVSECLKAIALRGPRDSSSALSIFSRPSDSSKGWSVQRRTALLPIATALPS